VYAKVSAGGAGSTLLGARWLNAGELTKKIANAVATLVRTDQE
jgi:hypothetical protein